MSILTVVKGTLFAATSGFPGDFTVSGVDLGTGLDRYAFVAFRYEKWTDINPQALSLGGQPTEHIFTGAAPGSNHAEFMSIWALEDPPEGQVTLAAQNGPSGVDVAVTYMVLRGLAGAIAPGDVHSVGRDPSEDGSMSVDIDEGKAVVWFVVRDFGSDSDWEAVDGSEIVTEGATGFSTGGMSFAEGFDDPGSAGPQQVGATLVAGPAGEELLLVAIEVSRSDAGNGDPDPDPEPTGDALDDIRVAACMLEKRRQGSEDWESVHDLTTCGGGGSGDPQGVEDIRVEADVLQQKKFGTSAYVNVIDLSQFRDDGGGGSGDTVNVEGYAVTSSQLDYQPTTDPVLGRQRIQAFVDDLATFGVPGVLQGQWAIEDQIALRDGLRMRGEGMQRTVIDCPVNGWTGNRFTALHLDNDGSIHRNGIFLSDFRVIGADKGRTDNGALININGVEDFDIRRLWGEDASSYTIFVSGYGNGSFTNDITSDFWNSTFRGRVQYCVTRRGQIGIGTEGGAQAILIAHNHHDGLGADGSFSLHAYRSASGRNVTYFDNWGAHSRTGFLLDRHQRIECMSNELINVRYGWAIGGYNSGDPALSHAVRIHHNYHRGVAENGINPVSITDSFQGNSTKHTDGLWIESNDLSHNISLSHSRRIYVSGNMGPGNIRTSSGVTGIVANNLMDLGSTSSGVEVVGANRSF